MIQNKSVSTFDHLIMLFRDRNSAVFIIIILSILLIPQNSISTHTRQISSEISINDNHLSWNLEVLGVEDAWSVTMGSDNVTVAIIDTGIVWNEHELPTHIRWTNDAEIDGIPNVDDDNNGFIDDFYGWDFSDNDNSPSLGRDGTISYHGTSIANVIAGLHDGDEVYGIAPGVKIMDLRVMDSSGYGFIVDIYDAINYAINQRVSVINLSAYFISSDFDLASWNTLLQRAYEHNIAIVSILKRGGGGEVPFPADSEFVIATSSISEGLDPRILQESGPELELLAPGHQIPVINSNGELGFSSGTSFAAPHVTGTIALMRSARNDLSIDKLRHTLHYAATDIDGTGWSAYSGYGVVNASKSIYAWLNFETLDFDGDGLTNQDEIELGLLYFDSDSDGDRMPDDYELTKGFDPTDPVDASFDADGDGINNRVEYLGGSDPLDPNDPHGNKTNDSRINNSVVSVIIAILSVRTCRRK